MQTQKENPKTTVQDDAPKPKLEDYIKTIEVGKEKTLRGKAIAGIDFSSYAFALEKYVKSLEDRILTIHDNMDSYQKAVAFNVKTEAEADRLRKEALGYAMVELSRLVKGA